MEKVQQIFGTLLTRKETRKTQKEREEGDKRIAEGQREKGVESSKCPFTIPKSVLACISLF